MISDWNRFVQDRSLPKFSPSMAWSFSAIFRETLEDVHRHRYFYFYLTEDRDLSFFFFANRE